MIAVGVICILAGYGLAYSGVSQILSGGKGVGLLESFGVTGGSKRKSGSPSALADEQQPESQQPPVRGVTPA